MNMSKICMVCHKDPTSHSFSKLCQDGKTSIFYTNVGEATKYNDRKGIITHMDNMLINHVPDKWAWIFDAGKFQQKHLMEIQLTRDIIKLVSTKHNHNLEYVKIKNVNSLFKSLLNLVGPLLLESEMSQKMIIE